MISLKTHKNKRLQKFSFKKVVLDVSGFTAVELLVTLFVAAAFIIAGYQLFNVVMTNGGEMRAKSTAANTAYSYLRQYSNSATNPCTAQTPLTDSSISVSGLSAVTITVSIECSQSDAKSLSKINATIKYNKNPQQTLTYSTYVDKSSGASTETDVTDGLIGWWKLNGDTNSSVGGSNGSIVGSISPTTGQNGLANNAYSFASPCCNYIYIPSVPNTTTTAVTYNAWVYPTAYPAERAAIMKYAPTDSVTGDFYVSLNSDGSLQFYQYGATSPGYHSTGAGTVPLNQWSMVTVDISFAYGISPMDMYVNGVNKKHVISEWAAPYNYGIYIGAQGSNSSRQFDGKIDDVRIYNRAISASEILQLYTNGAK